MTNTPPFRSRPGVAPALLALLVIGSLLALFVAQREGIRPDHSQTERDRMSWTVWDGHTLGQIFRINPAATVGVRVWLVFPAGRGAGSVQADLFSFELNQVVATTQLDIAQIEPNGPTDLWFPEIAAIDWPADQPLVVELRLTTEGVAETTPIGGLGSSNLYGYGTLVIDNEQFAQEDLAFVVLQRGSYLDQWLPISRIAEHRPGVFGWPPFYALLAWLMLCAAGMLAFSFAHAALAE